MRIQEPKKLTTMPEPVVIDTEATVQPKADSASTAAPTPSTPAPGPSIATSSPQAKDTAPLSSPPPPASTNPAPATTPVAPKPYTPQAASVAQPENRSVPLDAVITRNPMNVKKPHVPLPQRVTDFVRNLPSTIAHLPKNLRSFFSIWVIHIASFTVLLLVYLLNQLIRYLVSFRIVPNSVRQKVLLPFQFIFAHMSAGARTEERTINRINLIDLAMRNMMFKRSRAIITVGGMAIGIAAIVFLVSIGFGLQQMVLNRVARLDELMQTDVSTIPGSRERITDKTLSSIKELKDVGATLPLIASVAKVTFNNSVTDMAVYAVTSDFLKQSAIQPVHGKIFDSNEIAVIMPGKVAGIALSEEQLLDEREVRIQYAIAEDTWVKVRESPQRSAKVIGYTRRTEGENLGIRVWGGMYPEARDSNRVLGSQAAWINADFPLWKKTDCTTGADCEDGYQIQKDASGFQAYEKGYIAQVNVSLTSIVDRSLPGSVLGDTTEDASDSGELASEWVDIASESAATAKEKVTKVDIPPTAKKQAVVNRAMLKLLGISEDQAVGKTFAASYVIIGDLLENNEEKIESAPTDYTIVGVIPEEKTPFFYIPFIDLRSLGVRNYSQLKVVSKNKETLSTVRKQIEALGFSTRSVADTVKQIDRLFATARTVLLILGMVALAVAALGMFNTLTVSLLERTREVGLMKAMGMKSHEVQELFLTESMVMGFFGGILGILIGFGAGELIGVLLSLLSIGKGVGYVDVAYLPPGFVIFIFSLSLVVGIFTGIYPARRATKISALNALRYE